MAPKALHKVQKQVRKKKGTNASIHENSRDSQRLQRAVQRQNKLANLAVATEKSHQPLLERVAFFQNAMADESEPLMQEALHAVTEDYVNRRDEEIAELEKSRRPGRPPSSKEVQLKQRRDQDRQDYKAGLWMPNLLHSDNIELLREWKGDWGSLNNMKFIRVFENGGLTVSAFPPRKGN